MDTQTTLKYISVQNHLRKNRILNVIQDNHIPYCLESLRPDKYENIIIRNQLFKNPNMKILVSAHYDAVNKSDGANDNGAAVTVLLKLAEYAKTHTSYCPIDFALFDKEETGFSGSYGYVEAHIKEHQKQPIFFINCDVIGCGDGIVMVKHNNNTSYPNASNVMNKNILNKYNITEYTHFPPSDAYNLSMVAKMNGIELSVFPQADIIKHSSRNVFKYMHNSIYDDIMYINYNMVEKVYNLLIDLLFEP